MNKKLYRSTDGQMIAGVCAGLGKYLDIDPTVIRVLFALLAAFGGGGLLLYLVLMVIMPVEPGGVTPFSSDAASSAPMDSEAIISSPTAADEPIDPKI